MADLTSTPLVPTVARLYTQNGYQRASVKSGPGAPLVKLADAEAAIGTWRQRAELRQAAFEKMVRERDALMAAAHDAKRELADVPHHRAFLTAMAAYQRLHQALTLFA